MEGYYNFPTNKAGLASPLYAKIPKVEDGSCMTWILFAKRYDLSAQGLSLKHVKVPKDIGA